MSLQLTICVWPDETAETHVFQPEDTLCKGDYITLQAQVSFNNSVKIDCGEDRRVYSGILSGLPSPDVKAVCKLAQSAKAVEAFRHEAELYNTKLRDLQGVCVPRYYGFYTGIIHGKPAACLLLEHCGDTPSDWDELTMDLRVRLVRILLAVHARELEHKDIDLRNVLVDNQQDPPNLFLIDFECAKHHHCKRSMDVALYELTPHRWDFGCEELYITTSFLSVWTPARYDFMGETVSLVVADTPEKLAKFASTGALDMGHDYVYGVACKALLKYYNRWIHRRAYLIGEKYEVLTPLV